LSPFDVVSDDYLKPSTKSGPLQKRSVLRWKTRFFQLKGSTLFMLLSSHDTSPHRVIALQKYKLEEEFEVNKRLHCFRLVGKLPKEREWVLSATTSADYQLWLKVLKNAMADTPESSLKE